MNVRRFVIVVVIVAFAAIATTILLLIFVWGTKTKAYPEVVHLSKAYCSAVAVQSNVLLTAEHCPVNTSDDVWDAWGNHVADVDARIAACLGAIEILRVRLRSGYSLSPVTPDVADLADSVPVRIVGFGYYPLSFKAFVDGAASNATCPGCSNPRTFEAKLSGGYACKGDSGGAAYTMKAGSSTRFAGILEGALSSSSCSQDVLMHRLDAAGLDWVTKSITDYSGNLITSCP